MSRPVVITRTHATGILAAVAASGLILTGCGSTSGSTASSSSGQSTGSTASAAPASSGPARSGSASSGSASSGSAGSVSTGSGAAAFFPLAVGNKWVYVDKLSAEQGTVTNQVISVTPVASGSKVIMKDREDLGGGAPNTSTSAVIVHSDGSISVPMTTVGGSFKVKSGSVIWPSAAQLASGQAHHDTLVMTMTMPGHTSTIRAHVVVRGEGTHAVTVPAGTYQATIIDEVMSEKFSGIAIVMDIRTWVANGVGPVKTEMTSNAAGKTAIVNDQELRSFTKG
jgi:hypothetical protein